MEQAENKVLWRTCRQIADGLGLSLTTTWRMLRRGDLPAIRAGRVWCVVPVSVAPYVLALAARGVFVRPVTAPAPTPKKRHAPPPPVDVAAQHAAVAEMVRRSVGELALTDCRNLDMSESRHIAVQHDEISTVWRKCDSVAETQHGAPHHAPVSAHFCCTAVDPLGGRVMYAASSPLLALPPTKKYPPTVLNPRPESESADGEE